MIIMNDTTIGANWNINTRFFVVFITLTANINKSRSLTTTDTLGFTGNADRTAADTNFNKISTSLS